MKRIDTMTSRARKLYPWVLDNSKTADRLTGRCLNAICSYCGTDDLDYLRRVVTVQFPIDQAARDLWGGDLKAAQSARNGLISAEILDIVEKGRRGFATLYVILPLPEFLVENAEKRQGNKADSLSTDGEFLVNDGPIPCHSGVAEQGVRGCNHKLTINKPKPDQQAQHRGADGPASNGGAVTPEEYVTPYCPVCGDRLAFFPQIGFGCRTHGAVDRDKIVYR